ncbi:hypothetical protein [Oscillatoria sp. FACHB-1406]|uniref:hypothetical protein n=1 Tax=Oscillatoria sp. FACHB-1406 TaxID=2692846 RepID=UPI0016823F4C|nr:hypothetical protein [Oscillatoria sp. FACHB-1406]
MKYFFLSDGWTVGRVWEFGGLWNESVWRRRPEIQKLNVGIVEQGETLWLYQVEDNILMLEVKPPLGGAAENTFGQVVLKRLIVAEAAIARIAGSETLVRPPAL